MGTIFVYYDRQRLECPSKTVRHAKTTKNRIVNKNIIIERQKKKKKTYETFRRCISDVYLAFVNGQQTLRRRSVQVRSETFARRSARVRLHGNVVARYAYSFSTLRYLNDGVSIILCLYRVHIFRERLECVPKKCKQGNDV